MNSQQVQDPNMQDQRGRVPLTINGLVAPTPTTNTPPAPIAAPIQAPVAPRRPASFVFPVLLIGAGVLLLLNTMNVVDWNIWVNVWRFWPLILIAFGLELLIGRRSSLASGIIALVLLACLLLGFWFWAVQPITDQVTVNDNISQAMQGATQANVNVEFGVGTSRIASLSGSDQLISGRVGHADNETISQDFHISGDTAYYTIKTNSNWNLPFFNIGRNDRTWDLSLNPKVPIDLSLNTSVGDATFDLESLNLTHLSVSGGAGNTDVTLPAHGNFDASISAGVGDLNVEVPRGMDIQISGAAGLGNRSMPADFTQTGDTFKSAGYDTSSNRINLNISAGVGDITVSEVDANMLP